MYNEAGPQPLSYADVILYMNEHRILSPEEREEFSVYLRALDSRYIELSHEKIRKTREQLNRQASSGNKGRGNRR
jgi:uncharacterized protein YutE (UPF0331/DUF86 family)